MKAIQLCLWNKYSASGKKLSKALNAYCWTKSTLTADAVVDPSSAIFNWGARIPLGFRPYVTNGRSADYSNKLSFFTKMGELKQYLPEYTKSREVAEAWLSDGDTVVCRQFVNASAGVGISIITPETAAHLPNVPLYTKYLKKNAEYRVHFFNKPFGQTEILIQKKKFVKGSSIVPGRTFQIRNYQTGWVFSTVNFDIPEGLSIVAKKFADVCNLTYGAFDIIHNEKTNSFYVLEVNTAPGLSEKTVDFYAENMKAYAA